MTAEHDETLIDSTGQKPASEETKQKLYRTMEENFSLLLPALYDSVYTLENLNQVDTSQIKSEGELHIVNLWKMLIQLQVFSLIANLDLIGILLSNFRTKSNPERRCNLKYITIMTYEVYKYLFGYRDDACNGKLEMLKSLANELGDSELISDIENFEQNTRGVGRISVDRIARNISVHYDQDPLKVYDNLESITEKEESERLKASLGMLESLSMVVKKYAHKYQLSMMSANDHYDITIKEQNNIFPDKDYKIRNVLDDSIISFSKRLDNIVQSCRQLGIVAEKLNIDKVFMKEIKPCIDSISLGIHMHFIYLDLSSAIRAYFNAECYYERQVNLRRINIIVYEGFKHIYGYNETDLSLSFWRKQFFPILESTEDSDIKNFLLKIESELKTFSANITIGDVQRREHSIHYRFEDRDNTLPLFYNIIDSNPFVEMQKALKLVSLLNKLIKLNTNYIEIIQEIQGRKS